MALTAYYMFMATHKGEAIFCHRSHSALKTLICRDSIDNERDLLDYSIIEVLVMGKQNMLAGTGCYDKDKIADIKFNYNS